MHFKEIKQRARGIVKGNLWNYWKGFIIYSVVLYAVGLVLSLIAKYAVPNICYYSVVDAGKTVCAFGTMDIADGVESIISSLIIAPIIFGFIYYTMCYARGKELNINDIFKFKKEWVATFLITFLISLFTTLWSLLFIIPGIVAALSYSMSQYIYCDEQTEPMETIKKSKELMDGYKWNYLLFNLSFIGWHILAVFTLGILYVWLMPYLSTANVLYYDELKKIKTN